MVKITEELIRKKAEHNEGIIGTLEELSLHQEDVERIENINNWCKDIQILYLQANLIPKIENLNKLKKLEYLNLAINNIEKIENLGRCEFLEKLDLTLNFIGDLESVCSLQNNVHLKHLYLTGNPCCDYEGYRQYVIAKLPQLITLDGTAITKSEKIKAKQNIVLIEDKIKGEQERYFLFRKEQKKRIEDGYDPTIDDEEFWKSTSENCPETRVEISRRTRKSKGLDKGEITEKKQVRLFTKEGRPLNMNQAKLDFKFNDENPEKFVLDLAVYKYLDTNLIEIDLQPIYARILIKGKVFQIVFPEEILTDKSTAKRSQTTGHLVLDLPKANYKPLKRKTVKKTSPPKENQKEVLEVPEYNEMDFSKIVENYNKKCSEHPEVPPLEYG
ncbi:Protein tilB-like Protein [Tribolium castaneum]|uniref:Protein tilB-like Protein n=1 Tax=Tribolium castaneum TaxID=7070 RepID=D6WHE0_TRICA|nr:PREDICTED: protein tilB homolog [Tribolium castaneum]EFA00650.1 Protein tilB-like Protein [Tribolium castaneum]|eukprot:XP_975217.1 PREDICTED: protein tilB homolog [Tribolium castaneum]